MLGRLGPCKAFNAMLIILVSQTISFGNASNTDVLREVAGGPPPALTTECIYLSLMAPTWTIEDFSYEDSDEASIASLTLTSNALQAKYNCSAQTPGHRHLLAGSCRGADGEQKYPPQFSFDTGGDLYIDHTWACEDNAAKLP